MDAQPDIVLKVDGLSKRFVLHTQGGATLDVLHGIDLEVAAGECVVLHGPSGAGKSTLLRCLFGNYRTEIGSVLVSHAGEMIDIATALPRTVIEIRQATLGYVSQFLRVVPRVAAIDVVAEPLRMTGVDESPARDRAAELLSRLNIPERLWALAPATFSGGEQQRVNIARGFAVPYPVMLLDEPTSALDAVNRRVVVDMIRERLADGAAMVGIFHDEEVRSAVATRLFDMDTEKQAA
jgi:alpha-D-ribose 1-methylphosphonate 5-triphosphate synthase subunit PhnL